MHNFTQFAIELNEEEMGIAPTDSRRRPDQRLCELGEFGAANRLKKCLEQAQRERIKEKGKGMNERIFLKIIIDNKESGLSKFYRKFFNDFSPLSYLVWSGAKSDKICDKSDIYIF